MTKAFVSCIRPPRLEVVLKVFPHRAGNDLGRLSGLREAGFRTVEGDVMFARNVPVMVHPAGLPKRLADGHLDYELEEVRELVGRNQIELPTLQQMLEAVEALGMILLLESKLPGTMARIGPLVKPFLDRVLVISFLGDELVEAANQRLETGPLMTHCPSRAVAKAMVQSYRCSRFLMDRWYVESDTAAMINSFGTSQQRIAFTVNDDTGARQMADHGFDAILSDNAPHLAKLRGFEPG